MEHHDTGPPGRARRPEPSWPTVIATTVRLWVERHPRTRVLRGLPAIVSGSLIIVFVAVMAVVSIGHPARSPSASASRARSSAPSSVTLSDSVRTRERAATWIAGQVAASAIVACDPAMCAALQAAGIPAGRLLALGPAAADPLGSDVVVATPALRSQFGARLPDVYAPVVIASFGSGSERIDVRAIAPNGAAAYQASLAADRRARVAAGGQVLRNPRIRVTAGAQAVLRAGEADPRLLLTLVALAAQQPVWIIGFSDAPPGASPAVPYRGAEIAPLRGGVQAGLRSMLSFLDAQQAPFLPLRASVAPTLELSVEYAAPSPIGLLSGP
jgi:hypothetical protein